MNNQYSYNQSSYNQPRMNFPTTTYNPNEFSASSLNGQSFARQPSFGPPIFSSPSQQSFQTHSSFGGHPSAYNDQSNGNFESLQNSMSDFFTNNLQQADNYNHMFLGSNDNQPPMNEKSALQQNVLNITRELGSGPSMMDDSPDGSAAWKYSSISKNGSVWCRVFNKIEVCAEKRHIKTPKPHIGCVTTTTKVKLDCDLIRSLQKELQQISYCPATKNLRITSDSLEHCLAALALVCSCQQRKISVGKVKYYNLVDKYFRLTTPGDRKYCPGAKYALIKFIQS